MKYLWLLPLLLFGCSTADTTGNTTNRTYNITINNSDSSSLYMEFPLDVVASTSETVDQSPTNQPSTDFDIPLSMALQGGTASAAGPAAKQELKDLRSDFRAWQDFRKRDSDNDNRVDNSVKPTDPVTPAIVPVEIDVEDTPTDTDKPPVVDPEKPNDMYGYSNFMTLFNTGDKMSFRTDGETTSTEQDKFVFEGKFGPDFGPTMMIVWSDGNTLKVPNTSKMAMQGASGGYRKFQPGGAYSYTPPNPDIPYMEVYAARGTHPKSVTIFYNEVKK